MWPLTSCPSAKTAWLLAEHRSFAERLPAVPPAPPAGTPDPGRRLRVGYVSPDLRLHPVGQFDEPVLAHHDRAQVEAFCYAESTQPSSGNRPKPTPAPR